MSDLRLRVLSGVALGAVFILSAWMGGLAFIALIALASALIWSEWTAISLPQIDDRINLYGYLSIALVAFCLWVFPIHITNMLAILMGAVAVYACLVIGQSRALIGYFYSLIFLVAMVELRGGAHQLSGVIAIAFLCAIVWATDIGAYFVGRKFGGAKLAPTISPNKTWSGAVGGVVSAVAAALLVAVISNRDNLWSFALLAVLLSVISQYGDLYESRMKRAGGVKDSGRILPGHGGVMDRVDGLVFAAFALWLVSVLFGDPMAPSRTFFA